MWWLARALFGSWPCMCLRISWHVGSRVTLIDGTDNCCMDAAIRPDTTMVFFESIRTPTLEVVDMRHVVKRRILPWAARCWWMTRWRRRCFPMPRKCGAGYREIISTTKHCGRAGRMPWGGAI